VLSQLAACAGTNVGTGAEPLTRGRGQIAMCVQNLMTWHGVQVCGERSTLTIAELVRTFGPDRNVDTIGKDVLKCRHKGSRREGYPCPTTYQA
jgi:hypothetical protein